MNKEEEAKWTPRPTPLPTCQDSDPDYVESAGELALSTAGLSPL